MKGTGDPAPKSVNCILPAALFWMNLVLAAGLALLVVLAPFADAGTVPVPAWGVLQPLFAADSEVRQTALATAIALTVTAFVFFRSPAPVGTNDPAKPKAHRLPPTNVVGA